MTTGLDAQFLNRARGCAVGAAVGDALGMPLEFTHRRSLDNLVRDMQPSRLPAGSFTDDTEMALALAESLQAHMPLDPDDLVRRFVSWWQSHPSDVGLHTRDVLSRVARGIAWETAVQTIQERKPDSAGNGSLMRCWPVALAHWNRIDVLITDSALQSRVTHPHADCVSACVYVNVMIAHLLRGRSLEAAQAAAESPARLSEDFAGMVIKAPEQKRENLRNSGWVRCTLESVMWGLANTTSFEDALVQVVNLGEDADTAGAVVGALAGAYYGLDAIPERWVDALRGEWPLNSGMILSAADFVQWADQLVELEM